MDRDLFGKLASDYSLDILREFEPPEGYYLAFSGGKDSVVLLYVAKQAKVKFDAHYMNTTCDPPQVIQLIRSQYPEVEIDNPPQSMWQLIPKKGFPLRNSRWCCETFKERGGINRIVLTGIRSEESINRRKRPVVESCYKENKRLVHPLIHWKQKDIWDYIHENKIAYLSLYDRGYKRVGCVLCPFERNVERSFRDFPKICEAWHRAFGRLYETQRESTKSWPSAEAMWKWWLNRHAKYPHINQDQFSLFI